MINHTQITFLSFLHESMDHGPAAMLAHNDYHHSAPCSTIHPSGHPVQHGSSTWLEHGEGVGSVIPSLANQAPSSPIKVTQPEVIVDDSVESPSDLTFINNNQRLPNNCVSPLASEIKLPNDMSLTSPTDGVELQSNSTSVCADEIVELVDGSNPILPCPRKLMTTLTPRT